MQSPSPRRASGVLLAQLLAIAVAVVAPLLSLVASAPAASAGGTPLPGLPPGVVNDCPDDAIFFMWKYNDSATVGIDKGCSTVNDVTRVTKPDLIANRLHVSCSDTISADGVPTKSDLGSPTRRVASYVIQKKDGSVCGMGNPAEDPKTDISIVKTASKVTVSSGEEVTYTLTVKNVGNTTAHNVIASDVLPDGVTFVSASAGCTYDGATRRVTCNAGDLPIASSPTGSCSDQTYYKWEYNDSATVGIDEGCSSVNDVTRAINPALVANLLHVSCSDTISADGVPTKSDLGSPTRRVKAYYIRKKDGKTCGMGTFSPPQPKQFTIKVTVTKSHCNTATVTSTEPDSDTSNNSSKVCVTVPGFGYIEICKSAANGMDGAIFAFVVEGKTYKVPAGACTSAIKVSSGVVTVKEKWVVGVKMVGASTIPSDRLVSVDAPNRIIKVEVVAGSIAQQTIVNVVNKAVSGTLKVCQVAGAGVTEGTLFSFSNSVTSKTISVPAGPAPGGYCVVYGTFSGKVTVTQTAKSDYYVSDIKVEPADRLLTRNLTNRLVQVQIGGGVTEVTFTDNRAGY